MVFPVERHSVRVCQGSACHRNSNPSVRTGACAAAATNPNTSSRNCCGSIRASLTTPWRTTCRLTSSSPPIKQSHRPTRGQERNQLGFRQVKRARGFLGLHARISNLHDYSRSTAPAHDRRHRLSIASQPTLFSTRVGTLARLNGRGTICWRLSLNKQGEGSARTAQPE
jgi:hypothetical protein